MDGFLLIDKPAGITSMDVIRRLRRVLGTRKLGHTGTLDPAATGLLPVTVGSCTKLAKFVSLEPKEYAFEVVFGVLTETADDEGAVVETGRADVNLDEVREAATAFVGEIEQRPPRFSAVKVDGRRAYELAREGVDFELPARPVTIHALDVLGLEHGVAQMRVRCGGGTYVRSLAVDIAARLGTVAHARHIHRLRVGPWRIEQAVALDAVTPHDVRPPLELLVGLPRVELDAASLVDVRQGRALLQPTALAGWVALTFDDELVAVAEATPAGLQPRRVIAEGDA